MSSISLLDTRNDGPIVVSNWRTAGDGDIEVVEPATRAVIGRVGCASVEDVAAAAAAAAAAQPAWAALSFERRAEVLRAAGEALLKHGDEIAEQIVRESGSIAQKGRGEVSHGAAECFQAAAQCAEPYGILVPSHDPMVLGMVRRMPVGVVAAITPWNAPLGLALRTVAPALALGNAVILKPDPRTPICGGVVVMRIFEEAGLPAGVLSLVNGGGEIGAALCRQPAVRVVSFTGSTEVGRRVAVACAEQDRIALLELGGNNPIIVLGDADVPAAVAAAARGSFGHAGQICMATGRHLVHRDVHDEYLQRLVQRATELRVGDPREPGIDVGPLIDADQHARVTRIVERSIGQGARRLTGRAPIDDRFLTPTVLACDKAEIAAWSEEVFGPVAAVMAFDTVDEAVALANSTPYGLVAAVFGSDLQLALDVGRRLRVGMIHINDTTIGDEPHVPFGGTGASGNQARFGGTGNWDAFTESQWITVPTTVPAGA